MHLGGDNESWRVNAACHAWNLGLFVWLNSYSEIVAFGL